MNPPGDYPDWWLLEFQCAPIWIVIKRFIHVAYAIGMLDQLQAVALLQHFMIPKDSSFFDFCNREVMEEEFETPYMGPAMMTGAEVGFAWARMNRNSIELDRLCSFADRVGRDEFFDGELSWASCPEGFLAMIQGDPIPMETDVDYEVRMKQLRDVCAEFWMPLLYRCGLSDNSCLNDPFFYDGFLEGAIAVTDPDYAE